MKLPHVAIVGATGAVGVEMLLCLEQRNFELSELTLLASARSAGKTTTFRGKEIVIKELTHDSFAGIDIAVFSAGGDISREFAPSAAAAGLSSQRPSGLMFHRRCCSALGLALVPMAAFVNAAPPGAAVG